MKESKNPFLKLLSFFRMEGENPQLTNKFAAFVCITAILLMLVITVGVFFAAVKGSEEVLVPNVVGKPLEEALLEMQAKELYPKIQLRYSDTPDSKGKILTQNPVAGTIVKASRRINLVVSQGVVLDQLEDYTGMKIDELRAQLQTLFSATKILVTIAEPMYKADASEPGTILAQDPPPGTPLTDYVELRLVVSRGPHYDQTQVPDLVGMEVPEILAQLPRSKLIFDFTSRTATAEELSTGTAGTIVSQELIGQTIPNHSRVPAEFSFPPAPLDGRVYGIFAATVPEYPYPLDMQVQAITPDGKKQSLTSFSHPGGQVTVPYFLPQGTQLLLMVENREIAEMQVQ